MKAMGRHDAWIAAAAFAALAACGTAEAVVVLGNGQSIAVTNLFASGSDRKVLVGDKLFTFKSIRSSTISFGHLRIAGYVASAASRSGGAAFGFDLVGQVGDFTPGNGGMAEINLQYEVEVEAGAYAADWRICDTGLSFDGMASGTGSFARVDETIIDRDTNRFLGNMSAFWNAGPPVQTRLSTSVDYRSLPGAQHGFRALEVNKDLKFFAAGANGWSAASFVRQEFTQFQAPSPGPLALVCLSGLLGAGRRRRNA